MCVGVLCHTQTGRVWSVSVARKEKHVCCVCVCVCNNIQCTRTLFAYRPVARLSTWRLCRPSPRCEPGRIPAAAASVWESRLFDVKIRPQASVCVCVRVCVCVCTQFTRPQLGQQGALCQLGGWEGGRKRGGGGGVCGHFLTFCFWISDKNLPPK